MSQYRWITSALVGPWCPTKNEAMYLGQAFLNPDRDNLLTLRDYVSLETQPL